MFEFSIKVLLQVPSTVDRGVARRFSSHNTYLSGWSDLSDHNIKNEGKHILQEEEDEKQGENKKVT